ncbi:MAG: hypothetical protein V2I54_11055 [Bacteroidales bacterium]|jgi:hypothetical protein|nr:hypothetical protein [Bacteroidales bacterium]
MKEKDAYVDYEPQQLVLYVEKDDGSYGPIQTGSYISKNYLDDFWEKMVKLRLSLLEKLKKNEITPVYYYKMIHDFNDLELSRRTGIALFRVKRHQKVKKFKKIKLADLQRYAYAFDIPVANLLQIIALDQNEKLPDTEEDNSSKGKVKQTKTENPFVVITKFEVNQK